MSKISCHVLDTSLGRPAAGIPVRLERRNALWHWSVLGDAVTNPDGRAVPFEGRRDLAGVQHRITFDVAEYFRRMGQAAFYPEVRVCFVVSSTHEPYHIPLLLSPFGYSTYRGS
jgi:5-hydroxyisourate hydrolase